MPGAVTTLVRVLAWSGWVCVFVVVLAHIAERWHLLPGARDLPNSTRDALDLFSTIVGFVLIFAIYVARYRLCCRRR